MTLRALARWCYNRRGTVIASWVVLLLACVTVSVTAGPTFTNDFSTPGSESKTAAELVATRFPDRSAETIDVVVHAEDGVAAAENRRDVERLLGRATRLEHVTSVGSPFDPAGAHRVSGDGRTAFASLYLDVPAERLPSDVPRSLLAMAEVADRPGLVVELAGAAISNAEQGASPAEAVGFLVAAAILVLAFGSLVAAGLPLMVALVGLGVGGAVTAGLSRAAEVPDFAPAMASLLAIGVGIDYALLIVTRFRAGLRRGLDPRSAAVESIDAAGRSVLFAGLTVVTSMLGMLLMGLGYVGGLALVAVGSVVVVMVAAVTLLPAVFGFLGTNVDRLAVRRARRRTAAQGDGWRRWSRLIARRPWAALAAGALVLAVLSAPATGLRLGWPDAGNESSDRTTRRAYDLLTDAFGPGTNGPLLIAMDLRRASDPDAAVAAVAANVAATPGVAAVTPPSPDGAGRAALFTAVPASGPQADETRELVRRLRGAVIPTAVADSGARALVGGFTAATLDQSDRIADRLPVFVGSVVGLSLLLLLLVFRSVPVAVKAAVMTMLSVGAAYGVVALVTGGGFLGDLVNVPDPTPVANFIPMIMFAILFGLSMDYEVFLLSRVREEYERTGDSRRAVADGLAETGRVITAAAAIMVAVFASFALDPAVFLKVVGIGMATAILVDATVVRSLLVPSTMEILGDLNWWLPRWLDRVLPKVTVEPAREDLAPVRSELEPVAP